MNNRVFISHTKFDYVATKMAMLLNKLQDNNFSVFCSSNPDSGIETGKKLHEEMNRQLNNCDYFLAIITENYIRSPHCLYELSVARFLNKANPIIIYSKKKLIERISDIADPEWISICLDDPQGFDDAIHQFAKSFHITGESNRNDLAEFLRRVVDVTAAYRPFVGMSKETYRDLHYYCQREGITKFGNGQVYTKEEMVSQFEKAKTIYIVSTTGAGLLKTLKEEALIKALGNKAKINILLPDRDSLFCQDVAEAECSREGFNPIIAEQNRYRIESEFVATIQYLNEAYSLARQKYGSHIGTICCYNSRTLLRQTIVLCITTDNKSWGWINMTMAPLRTTDTPSIAISDTNIQKGLDKMIVKHCECLMRIATNRRAYRRINGKTLANKLDHDSHEAYWLQKRRIAANNMKARREARDKVLIEIAAQHPLDSGRFPNEEFKRRLATAIRLSQEIGPEKVWFYVPGSRHQYKGVADLVSLSEAGRNYLVEHGVESSRIFSDDANKTYKGELGVYNSADESYVASRLFFAGGFGRLICVCSPYQTMRKSFYYLEFGLIAECYGIPDKEMFHDPISEYFGSLRYTVIEDHSWQGESSEAANSSRKERIPAPLSNR